MYNGYIILVLTSKIFTNYQAILEMLQVALLQTVFFLYLVELRNQNNNNKKQDLKGQPWKLNEFQPLSSASCYYYKGETFEQISNSAHKTTTVTHNSGRMQGDTELYG